MQNRRHTYVGLMCVYDIGIAGTGSVIAEVKEIGLLSL